MWISYKAQAYPINSGKACSKKHKLEQSPY
jgi:hypothetical protein